VGLPLNPSGSLVVLHKASLLSRVQPEAATGLPDGISLNAKSLELLPDELYLVGTAHVSKPSADLAYHAIRTVHPDTVVFELCQ